MKRYIPMYRPPQFCTLPAGVRWAYVEAPHDLAYRLTHIPASRHTFGVIETDRDLTAEEIETFQLRPAIHAAAN